ncbi:MULTISPECIES: hypothetical protein [Streptomyces]|uniref:hypothetical protein n=1 Tax=Streptomyces TaxID=1883 RepID=UPI00345B7C58
MARSATAPVLASCAGPAAVRRHGFTFGRGIRRSAQCRAGARTAARPMAALAHPPPAAPRKSRFPPPAGRRRRPRRPALSTGNRTIRAAAAP